MEDLQTFCEDGFRALAFLSEMQLVHTDLKPENILLADRRLVRRPQPQRYYEGAALAFRKKKEISSGQSTSSTTARENSSRTQNYDPSPSDSLDEFSREVEEVRDADFYRPNPANPGIKIIDFGGATFATQYHSSIISTRQYRAPEVLVETARGPCVMMGSAGGGVMSKKRKWAGKPWGTAAGGDGRSSFGRSLGSSPDGGSERTTGGEQLAAENTAVFGVSRVLEREMKFGESCFPSQSPLSSDGEQITTNIVRAKPTGGGPNYQAMSSPASSSCAGSSGTEEEVVDSQGRDSTGRYVAGNWDEKADVFSFGAIMMELYQGTLLFYTHNNEEHFGVIEHVMDSCFGNRLVENGKPEILEKIFRKIPVGISNGVASSSQLVSHLRVGPSVSQSEITSSSFAAAAKGVRYG